MKFFRIIIASFFFCTPVFAQQDGMSAEDDTEQEYRNGIIAVSNYAPDIPLADSLRLPEMDYSGRVMRYPSWSNPFWGGCWGWDLHEGLNVSVGASATVASGGGRTTSGFGQNIAVMYADAVSSKFSYAVGGYLNNYTFGPGAYREGGISAMLDYKVNDRLEVYAYAQLHLTHKDNGMPYYGMYGPYGMYSPYGMYGQMGMDMMNGGDRIGGGARYQIGKHSWIQLQVEYARVPVSPYNPYNSWGRPGAYPMYPGWYGPGWWY